MSIDLKRVAAPLDGGSKWSAMLKLSAGVMVFLQPWLSVLLSFIAAWQISGKKAGPGGISLWAALLFFMPLAWYGVALATGYTIPYDDLLRHVSAWTLNFDYRAQYPWSTVPQISLWVGYEWLLGLLQQAGLSKEHTVMFVAGLAMGLTALVSFALIRKGLKKSAYANALLLLVGALAYASTMERAALGRPEAFLLVIGAAAWLCTTPGRLMGWVIGFLVLTPFYWLGWVYAPFVLLASSISLKLRVAMAAALGVAHLLFWELYSGGYLELMVWLKGTLSVLALENKPMVTVLGLTHGSTFAVVLSFSLALALRKKKVTSVYRILPLLAVMGWLALPDQIRYHTAVVLICLPFLATKARVAVHLVKTKLPVQVLEVVAAGIFILTTGLSVPVFDEPPKFEMPLGARVYSEQPYATVFYAKGAVSVEPSFALGATKPEWRGVIKDGVLDCALVKKAGFTHVIEKSLMGSPPTCLVLEKTDKRYRQWRVSNA